MSDLEKKKHEHTFTYWNPITKSDRSVTVSYNPNLAADLRKDAEKTKAEWAKEKGNVFQSVVNGYLDYMGRAAHDFKETVKNDFKKTVVEYGQGKAKDRDSLRVDREANKSMKREGVTEHHERAVQLHKESNVKDKSRSQEHIYDKTRVGHER